MNKTKTWLLLCPFMLLGGSGFAQQDLTERSMEELLNMKVYSAAKKAEPLTDTAAAVFVITSEDIRRSGATSIPELLRMVPGARVQKINSHAWDISIRGFNGSTFANKLLVLIDGRSVYTPLHGGVLWSLQDVVLEDVERIEVVRGPGGTLWGANAVNGVINVITKKAKDTQGGLISTGGGTEDQGFATARYGAKSGDWFYRTYAKYFNRDEGFRSDGGNVDHWDMAQAGFKAEKNKLTVQGDFYEANAGQLSTLTSLTVPPYTRTFKENGEALGGNLLGTYEDEDWFFKMYWDMTDIQTAPLGERRDQIELEYTRRLPLSYWQEMNWGLGYRLQLEEMTNTLTNTINSTAQADQLFSVFVQDELKAMDEKLKFILGSKLEHNIYTGLEVQPNVRLLYHLTEQSQVWAAASRAVRTPSRLDTDVEIFLRATPTPVFQRFIGNNDLEAENMRAFELGYRNQPTKNMMFDLAVFSNYYDELVGFDYLRFYVTPQNNFQVANVPTANIMQGEVHGAELSWDIQLREWWKVKGYYSFTKMSLTMGEGFKDLGLPKALNAATPVNTAYLRSSFNLPHGFELDTTFRYTSTFYNGTIPAVAEVDIHLSKTIKGWQVAIVGQNLVEARHKESVLSATSTQVERAWYIKITRRF